MNGDQISDEEAALKHVFWGISIRDLISCAEVNRRWRSLALACLRERLPSLDTFLSCWPHPDQPNPGDELFDAASCADIMGSKFWRYRNMAAKADMWPSFALIVSQADITGDRHKWLRVLLPEDCPVVYINENPKPAPDNEEDPNHHVCGVFIFSPPDGPNGQPKPRMQTGNNNNVESSSAANSSSTIGPTNEPSPEAHCSLQVPVLNDEGATLKNEAPGVLVLESLKLGHDCAQGNVSTSLFTDSTTGNVIQVTSGLMLRRLSYPQQKTFFERLKSSVGSTSNTLGLISGRQDEDVRYARFFFQTSFRGVPGIQMRWTLSFVNGPQELLDVFRTYVIIFKLLK